MSPVHIFQTVNTIYYGCGCREKLYEAAENFGAKTILLLTDSGVKKAGIIDPIYNGLIKKGFAVDLFDSIKPEPTTRDIDNAARETQARYDLLIGVGGGSTLDTMKVLSLLLSNQCNFHALANLLKEGCFIKKHVPSIAVPTTAGTGSEVTSAAVFIDPEKKVKKALLNPALLPDVAIVDPELTLGLPPKVTATTGMDALIHAMEAYTSRKATVFTDSLAAKAIELIYKNLKSAYYHGQDVRARECVAIGSLLAGLAVENAGTTAIHALAFALSGKYGLQHGVATSMLSPIVFNFNYTGNPDKFKKMGWLMEGNLIQDIYLGDAQSIGSIMRKLLKDLDLPASLKELNIKVDEQVIKELSKSSSLIVRPLQNNPKEMSLQDMENIFAMIQ